MVLFLVLVLLSMPHPSTACFDQERQTLFSFLATLSIPMKSWNTTLESDCCKWEDITCNHGLQTRPSQLGRVHSSLADSDFVNLACNPSNSITDISLPSRNLIGEISPVLSNLTNLSYLNLSYNFLSGSLPTELLHLSASLKFFDVSSNELSGVIPSLENSVIQVLNISSNLLTGLLPIIDATSLLSLNATNNSLVGPIPDYLCTNSPFLTSLAISYNKFSGNISPGLGNCSVLMDFQAGSNNLVGSVPDKLFKIASMQNLDLSTNFLTGSLLEAIGQLKKLWFLNVSRNILTGELPSAFVNCSDLRQLNLQENSLTGNLHFINFIKLSGLQLLDLHNNSFLGEIPQSIYTCKNLNALRLSRNKISGQISPVIENLRAPIVSAANAKIWGT